MSNKSIKVSSPVQRILIIVIGLFCLIFVGFSAKWFLGNSVSKRVEQMEVADLAISLAPNDPQTHFAKGLLLEKSFQAEDLSESLEQYEKAVALSPNDYRLWISYGKAKERIGDAEGAEKALKKALELAPNYAEVQWVYGNMLLRQDKIKEAFKIIRNAVDGDSKFASPAATTAWTIFDGDIDLVKSTIGDSAPVQSALATFLAEQKRFSESLDIWNKLPEAERKTTFRKDGEKIIQKLLVEKKYRSAIPLRKLLVTEGSKEVVIGKVTNGGFEEGITAGKQSIFEWQIASGNKPNVGQNTEQKRNGQKSLLIVFNSPRGRDFRSISQTVAVNSDENYTFEVFYKSDLQTSSTVKWEVVDSSTGKILTSTSSIETQSDWKKLSAEFASPEDCEGVIIRLVRPKCATANCAISGTVWFDDISLK